MVSLGFDHFRKLPSKLRRWVCGLEMVLCWEPGAAVIASFGGALPTNGLEHELARRLSLLEHYDVILPAV